jgi:hypothetical protein
MPQFINRVPATDVAAVACRIAVTCGTAVALGQAVRAKFKAITLLVFTGVTTAVTFFADALRASDAMTSPARYVIEFILSPLFYLVVVTSFAPTARLPRRSLVNPPME